jgi:hypothetical protein
MMQAGSDFLLAGSPQAAAVTGDVAMVWWVLRRVCVCV